MSMPPPPDQLPGPDEDDTGPLQVSTPSPYEARDDSPAEGVWAGRFDAPLTVSPRPVRRQRNPKVLLRAGAGIVAVAAVGGLALWLWRAWPEKPESSSAAPTTSTSPTSRPANAEDEARLLRLLPPGYASDSCDAVTAPKDALAQVNCDRNVDPGGPLSATYTLAEDKAALDAAFNVTIGAANRVNCPGNIQSPGPWRRNATPQKVSGILFCGLKEGRPTVAWTDDAKLVVSVVHAGPSGPTLPELYAWWSSHS
jgi:hypothetical protein